MPAHRAAPGNNPTGGGNRESRTRKMTRPIRRWNLGIQGSSFSPVRGFSAALEPDRLGREAIGRSSHLQAGAGEEREWRLGRRAGREAK